MGGGEGVIIRVIKKQKERKFGACSVVQKLFFGVMGVAPLLTLQKTGKPLTFQNCRKAHASMLLALENKRQHFEEDLCLTTKVIAA